MNNINNYYYYYTEWVDVATTLFTRIRDVLGSNLGRGASYSEVLRDLPKSFEVNAGIVLRLGHERFLPNHFQFIYHPTIRRATESVAK
jgi:hypothetical protein